MAQEIVGKIPAFSDEQEETEKAEVQDEEVKKEDADDDAAPEEEKETQPDTSTGENQPKAGDDADQKAIIGLQTQRAKLLKEIRELRGTRREAKQAQINEVEQQIDDLADLNADDVAVVERVLKAKGYVRRDDVQELTYEQAKNQELDKFLDKHPEYRPENDPNDEKWQQLQDELALYQRPADPSRIGELLEKSHRVIHQDYSKPKNEQPARNAMTQRLSTAQAGASGERQLSGVGQTFDAQKREMLRRGGWTDDDILAMEKNLK